MIIEYYIVILQFSFCDTVFELDFGIIEQFSVIEFIYMIYRTISIDGFICKYDTRIDIS